MARRASTNRKARRRAAPTKPYWEMTTAELRKATAELDAEFVGETFGEPAAAQRAQLARAKRKRGRPRVGQGVQVISVSVEKGLLTAVDRFAKRNKAKRAELVSRGLRALLSGEIPLAAR